MSFFFKYFKDVSREFDEVFVLRLEQEREGPRRQNKKKLSPFLYYRGNKTKQTKRQKLAYVTVEVTVKKD